MNPNTLKMSLKTLMKLASLAEEEEGGDWSKGKGKGKGKAAGKGKTAPFVNVDGTTQNICWDWTEWDECWKVECNFAHPKNGKNLNPPKAGKGWGNSGKGWGGSAGKAADEEKETRKVLGRGTVEKVEVATEEPKTEAARVKAELKEVLVDTENLGEKSLGVELAARVTLTTGKEIAMVNDAGEGMNALIAVDKVSKPYVENLKGYLSTRAERGGVPLGEKGVKKIHDTLEEFFKNQNVTKEKQILVKEETPGAAAPKDLDDTGTGSVDRVLTRIEELITLSIGKKETEVEGPKVGGIASPARKRGKFGASPKKRASEADKKKKHLEDIRRKLEASDEEEDEEEEEVKMTEGATGGDREAQLERAAEILGNLIDITEKKLGELGRTTDTVKLEYDEAMPLRNVDADWIGSASGTAPGKIINPSDFEAVTAFFLDNYTMADAEQAALGTLGSLLDKIHPWKRNTEVLQKIMTTHGLSLKGPKRLKISAILCTLSLLKKKREEAAA